MWEKRDQSHYHCDVFFLWKWRCAMSGGVASDVIYSLIDVLRCQGCCWCPSALLTFKLLSTYHAGCSVTIWMLLTSCTTADVLRDADVWEAPHVQRCCWRPNSFCHLVPVLTYLQDNFWCPERPKVDICCHVILWTSGILPTIWYARVVLTHIILMLYWRHLRSKAFCCASKIQTDAPMTPSMLWRSCSTAAPNFYRFCWSWPCLERLFFKPPMTTPWSL